MRDLESTQETRLPLSPHRDEKDSQGENMFLRCVSELVIESREVCRFPFLSHSDFQSTCSRANVILHGPFHMIAVDMA